MVYRPPVEQPVDGPAASRTPTVFLQGVGTQPLPTMKLPPQLQLHGKVVCQSRKRMPFIS